VRTVIGWGLVLSLLWAAGAWAHSDIDPRQSIPRKWETYTLMVPTETAAATVKVRLLVPAAFDIEVLEHQLAWQLETVRDAQGHIREVTWSGSRIPPQRFEAFRFLARNPAAVGTYRWQIEQHYQQGEPSTWEAQTQIVAPESLGSQRAEKAWRTAQVAMTVSLVALGIAVTLIIVTVIGIVQQGRRAVGEHEE
jgi:uncharacterized protein YcnI